MINFTEYGWTLERAAGWQQKDRDAVPARVLSVFRGLFQVISQYGESFAKLKGGVYYKEDGQAEEFPTVGDFVELLYQPSGDSLIAGTMERSSYFSRKDPDAGRGEQAVAANFDYVFIMMSMNHDYNLKRLERYLAVAWESGGIPVVVLTKADLAEDPDEYVRCAEETAAGVDVLAVSTVTGEGLERLKGYLKPGRTVVFLGSSGIGKSSLVNALAGEALMKVNEIRESDSRGRHTTTNRQMIRLENGALVIDTPGMRTMGMWEVTMGMGETFQDVESLIAQCRFSDCTHKREPGCAVREAIESGRLEEGRLARYRQLMRENEYAAKRERSKEKQAMQKMKKKSRVRQKVKVWDVQ